MQHFRLSSVSAIPTICLSSEPVKSRINGQWMIQFAHRINDGDGNFLGVLERIAIRLESITNFYRSVNLGEGGSISLLRTDGMMLARYPIQRRDDRTGVSRGQSRRERQLERRVTIMSSVMSHSSIRAGLPADRRDRHDQGRRAGLMATGRRDPGAGRNRRGCRRSCCCWSRCCSRSAA